MRISGGLAKGRRTATKSLLKSSNGEVLRPTSSKVREAIFDIIKNRIEGASFVDLYAGTGTVGLEALSRGADRAFFVEPKRLRTNTIKENAVKFGFREKAVVTETNALKFLKSASKENKKFDIFFLDPSYFSEEIINSLRVIGEKKLLTDNGMVIAEHFFKKKLPETVNDLRKIRSYKYGDTMLTIYMKKQSQENTGESGDKESSLSGHI